MDIMWQARDEREDNAVEYQHRSNVHYLPGQHARTNAAYSAQLLEADRRECRRAAIREIIETHQAEIARRNRLINTLRVEDQLLEAPDHV